MTTYLTRSGSFARPASTTPRPRKADDRRSHGLVALVAATVLTGTALGIAVTTPSPEPASATGSSAIKTQAGTVTAQAGTVTAVSPTSITVRSSDGLSRSYLVNAGTVVDCVRNGITAVKIGDPVAVTATVTAGTADATDIVDAGPGTLPRMLLPASPLAPAFRSCGSQFGVLAAP